MVTEKLAYVIVDNILQELLGRSGFDDWWDDIDYDIQDEIMNELAKIIVKEYENDKK